MNKLAYLGICLSVLSSCGKKTQTYKPSVESITESVYASGTIESKDQYQVFPKSSGILEKIFLREGDSVWKDAPLFSISNEATRLNRENAAIAAEFADIRNNQDKIREAEISLELSKKKLIQDSLVYARQKSLWNQKIGSKLQLEQSELAFLNSQTLFESARLRLSELRKQISFSDRQSKKNLQLTSSLSDDRIVKSQMEGKIYSILKNEGEMVTQQTPLAVIGSSRQFIINLQVDEYDIVKIKLGQTVYITLDSYRGKTFEAIITRINPIMNERTKTFVVEASFVENPPVLYPNLTVEANIVLNTKEKALTIPRNYLVNDSFVLDKSGNKKPVLTGLKDYRKIEILQGVSENDELSVPE